MIVPLAKLDHLFLNPKPFGHPGTLPVVICWTSPAKRTVWDLLPRWCDSYPGSHAVSVRMRVTQPGAIGT